MISNKQKCLEMWTWLADNPDKGKPDYMNYLYLQGRSSEYASCWACKEAIFRCRNDIDFMCRCCPIAWNPLGNYVYSCYGPNSPYYTWESANESKPQNIPAKRQAALDIVHLINKTWEE